jgi:hypothetical protein
MSAGLNLCPRERRDVTPSGQLPVPLRIIQAATHLRAAAALIRLTNDVDRKIHSDLLDFFRNVDSSDLENEIARLESEVRT